eukprot:6178497-Pleurochrysis_carterae.AAC.4
MLSSSSSWNTPLTIFALCWLFEKKLEAKSSMAEPKSRPVSLLHTGLRAHRGSKKVEGGVEAFTLWIWARP